MKKDKLEQFVRDNAENFNSLEPPFMAWDVIEKDLPAAKPKLVRRLWPYAWKVAAAVLIFASAWMLNDYTELKRPDRDYTKTFRKSANPELNELSDAEAYYTSQINSKQVELSAYAKEHPEIIADLKREFLEMDKKKTELKKDLAQSNADEKVIEAIILSYRVKIEILDEMLKELGKSNEDNSNREPVETNL